MAVRTATGEGRGTKASCAMPSDCVAGPLDSGSEAGLDEVEFDVRVIGLIEDNLWYARALELNLLGYGESFAKALEDLKRAIDAQVCDAARHNNLNTIYWSAKQRYFDLYDDLAEETPRRKLMVSLRKPGVLMRGAREQSEHANDFVSDISEIA